jgi:NADPH:quinone reductase-like Zn-dependent oxidoreductase
MNAALRPRSVPAAADQATMQAIVQRGYGTVPEDVLRLERVAKPVPARDEVLLRVAAAGVDRGTWHLMAGLPPT